MLDREPQVNWCRLPVRKLLACDYIVLLHRPAQLVRKRRSPSATGLASHAALPRWQICNGFGFENVQLGYWRDDCHQPFAVYLRCWVSLFHAQLSRFKLASVCCVEDGCRWCCSCGVHRRSRCYCFRCNGDRAPGG